VRTNQITGESSVGGLVRRLLLVCICGAGGCRSFDADIEAPAIVCQALPIRTVRFPGGNYGHVAVRDGLAVTCSGWSREDTTAVSDVSVPKRPKFLARFPAKGYSCSEPVFFGDRCYVPNGFSGTVIDLRDRQHPTLAGYLNPQFPKNGCSRLWVEDSRLYFEASDGCYRVLEDGLSFEKTDKAKRAKCPSGESAPAAELKDASVVVGETEIPFAYSLASVGAKDGAIFVYAPSGRGCAQLLTLSAKADGLSLFENRYTPLPLSRGNTFQAMGMQTACNVTRVGDLLFVDDGIVRRSRTGAWETILNRTRAVANASVDGTRIALAQCSRCRVLDFADPANVRILDVAPQAERPLHITGCHLRSNELFVAYTLVEKKGQDFIYKFPTKGYVSSFDLREPAKVLSTVEMPACIALDRVGDALYVSCRKGDFAVIDASDPHDLAVRDIRRDILDGDGYKVKSFGGRTFALNGHRVVELDTAVPFQPQVKRLYTRGDGTEAPSYDDFTVDGGRLYALAHASVDVFDLKDEKQTTSVPNDCGSRGVLTAPLTEGDAAVFAGHVPNPKSPAGVTLHAGRFGNSFGAYVYDWVRLPSGRYAVAYGEAGLVLCDEKGNFLGELPRGTDGWSCLFATEVLFKDGFIYAKDSDGKVFRLTTDRGPFREALE